MKTSVKDALIHAVTEYDRKQSTRRGYNPHALGQYFQRIDLICADIGSGANVRAAIVAGFTGRLADACLRAVGEPVTTDEECRGGYIYKPAH